MNKIFSILLSALCIGALFATSRDSKGSMGSIPIDLDTLGQIKPETQAEEQVSQVLGNEIKEDHKAAPSSLCGCLGSPKKNK